GLDLPHASRFAPVVNRPCQQNSLTARGPIGMADRRRQPATDPVEVTVRCDNLVCLPVRRRLGWPIFQDFFARRCSGQNQSIARPRHRHVEQPQLLAQRFQALPPFCQPIRQAWIPPACVRRLHQRTKTIVLVQNDAGFQVVEVEAFAKVRERHNRKLQSFALMNAHQLDGVLRLGERRLGLCFRVALRFDELQEAKQSLSLKLVELSGQRQQSSHIRAPLLTATLREQPGFVTRFVERRFETLRERSLPRDLPPCRERFRKRVHFRPRRLRPRNYLRVGELRFQFCRLALKPSQRRPKITASLRQSNRGQFIRRQADERRAQHSEQRRVLQRIVQQREQ